MTDWVASLLPAGTLALGSVLTMANTALTDRRVSRREQDKRRDELLIRRYEIERETLLGLQEAVKDHLFLLTNFAGAEANTPEQNKRRRVLEENEHKLMMLENRCLDRDAASAVMAFYQATAARIRGLESRWPREEYQAAQRALGEAIRRDPIEEITASSKRPRLRMLLWRSETK